MTDTRATATLDLPGFTGELFHNQNIPPAT